MARSTIAKNSTILAGGWQPAFTLDLSVSSAQAFKAVVEAFKEWAKNKPRPDLKLPDGWHDFTPEVCEQVLMLNAGNRQVSFATVKYYAKQMLAGEWMETGQPGIFDVHGNTADMQHRAWAGYLSGATFTSYVVNQRKEIPNGFAYIDNSKARSLQDGIYTAGLNGLSSVLSQSVKLAWQHESGALTPSEVHQVEKLTPRAGIAYVEAHPNLRQGARLMASDHAAAAEVIGDRAVASYMAFLILENHDEAVLDDFMEALAVETEEAGDPIAAFQQVLVADRQKAKPMKRHQVLGSLIKAFNAWVEGDNSVTKAKVSLRVNEDFPEVVTKQEQQDAAE